MWSVKSKRYTVAGIMADVPRDLGHRRAWNVAGGRIGIMEGTRAAHDREAQVILGTLQDGDLQRRFRNSNGFGADPLEDSNPMGGLATFPNLVARVCRQEPLHRHRADARLSGYLPYREIRWAISEHFLAALNLAGFVTGEFLKQSPPSNGIVFFNLGLTHQF
jgi:hypothetical protein